MSNNSKNFSILMCLTLHFFKLNYIKINLYLYFIGETRNANFRHSKKIAVNKGFLMELN